MTEKPQRQHEPPPNFHNGDDRDEMNALFQRHPSKPGQGSATRADNGVPVSTTEHPVHASSLDPATSGQAASTVTLPGTELGDDETVIDTRDEGDSSAPLAVATSSSTPNGPIPAGSAPENAGSHPPEGNAGSPPPAGSTTPPA